MALASYPASTLSPPATSKPSWNPLTFSGTELPVELLILVKVLALVLLLTNHVRILPDPWLPFVPGIDQIPPVLFQRTLQTVFVVSALALLFNRRVRLASLILGSTMLIAVVSSKAYYGNNKTFCGLMLFLTGLHVPGTQPWFLRWQLAITYFGAGLNKLLDGDWHSGVFFENWAVNRLRQPWYIALDALLPPMLLARLMCWTTIVAELGIVPAILIPKLYPWAIVANILFQAGLLLFTGTTFTLFFYSMSAASLAFVSWPQSPIRVLYDADCPFASNARKFFQLWDFDRRFLWTPRQPEASQNWLYLVAGDKHYSGFRALRMIVLLNPLTYMTIAGLIAAVPEMQGTALFRRVFVALCLFFLMPPLAWIADKARRIAPSVSMGTLFLLLCCVPTWAQFELGSVVGTVRDATRLPVANATVEIRSLSTNVSRQATTSTSGQFDFVSMPPARYAVKVRQQGFRETTQNIELAVGQRLELNFALEVGSVTEQVNVTAENALIETASSDLSNTRNQKQVVDLPLNSRNFTQLVNLAPGVNNRGNATSTTAGAYSSARGVNGATINGTPPQSAVYLIDGIQSMDTDAGALIVFPPVDSVQEFKVQTSAAPASYGGGTGIINVIFQSGTNEYHGVAYEFLRNHALDAKNYFDLATKPIPPFRMNQFGANIGGPVRIPRFFNGKDRLFFFVDYEGRRQNQAQSYTSTVPTAAFKAGDFSALLPRTQLLDPRSSPATPFPNNQVPASAVNPTSANLIALYPAPNLAGIANNYLRNPNQPTVVDQVDVRLDYRTAKSTLFGRMSHQDSNVFIPGLLPTPAVGAGPGRPGDTFVFAWQGVVGYGLAIGPHKYYEARLGYSRLNLTIHPEDAQQPGLAESLGIPNANRSANGLGIVTVSGTASLGMGGGNLIKINNNFELDQAFSWIKGRHELKFGGAVMTRRFGFYSPGQPAGSFAFNGAYTGYGLSDLMLGRPISSNLDIGQFYSLKRYQPAFYLQDNYRVSSRLTLNMGLRNDLYTPWRERHDRLAGLVTTNGGDLVPVGTAPYTGKTVMNGRYTNWGPRFGFAYSLTPKTVVRGGGGIFYNAQTTNSGTSIAAVNAPFNGSLQTSNSATNYAQALPISAGFRIPPERFSAAGAGFVYYPGNSKVMSANEWNVNVQRQLWANDVLTVAYVAQTAVHIQATYNANLPVPGPGPTAPRRWLPNLGEATQVCACGNSSYNSLQVSFEHRLSRGLTFLSAYTWSHSIDNTSASGSITIQNPFNLATNRGNSDFDLRHSLVLSSTYELPVGKGRRFLKNAARPVDLLLGGWQLNSIDTFQSGTPFTPVMVSSQLNSGSSPQWPNRIRSGALENRTIRSWFDTTAFVSPGLYTFGNSGRNILTGPGTMQFDVSLFKSFYLSENEARRLQFRVEAFNVLNTPQFNNPNASIGNAAAGQISSAGAPSLFQRTSRQIQFALKLNW